MSVLFNPGQVVNRPAAVVERVQRLVEEARDKLSQSGPKLGMMVDVDDTVFYTGFRTAALFEQFLQHRTPDADVKAELVRQVRGKLRQRAIPYLAGELLTGAVNGQEVSDWVTYWRNGFFTNEFLHQEEPYPVVADLLYLLGGRQIPVGYLTGRHQPSRLDPGEQFPDGMVEGTLSNLWRHGLPHGPVVFKPLFRHVDRDYKSSFFRRCLELDNPGLIPVAYMDNEPGITNLHDELMDELGLPHVSIWFHSVHAPCKEPVQLRPRVVVLKTKGD